MDTTFDVWSLCSSVSTFFVALFDAINHHIRSPVVGRRSPVGCIDIDIDIGVDIVVDIVVDVVVWGLGTLLLVTSSSVTSSCFLRTQSSSLSRLRKEWVEDDSFVDDVRATPQALQTAQQKRTQTLHLSIGRLRPAGTFTVLLWFSIEPAHTNKKSMKAKRKRRVKLETETTCHL